jgi:thioesterase domain-containing protein
MSPQDLQHYVRTRIPLAGFMQVGVEVVSANEVVLSSPLEPNLNVHGTFFGGSGTSLCLLAAWSLAHLRSIAEGLPTALVVKSHHMTFARPIRAAAQARAGFAASDGWDRYAASVREGGRGRVELRVALGSARAECAVLHATFALGRAD